MLLGTIPDYIFSSQSLNEHLFCFDNCNEHKNYEKRYPGHTPLWEDRPNHAFHKIFKQYFLLVTEVLGVKRGVHEIINYPEWYWRVIVPFGKNDFKRNGTHNFSLFKLFQTSHLVTPFYLFTCRPRLEVSLNKSFTSTD